MGLLRSRNALSVLGLVTVALVCVVYLLSVVLDIPLTQRPDRITVRMTATGGLFEGSSVTYRGVRVGTVRRIVLADGGGVEATVTLRDGVQVPSGGRARVRTLSPVGEQFLDFTPTRKGPPYLGDGDVVRADTVDLPVRLATAAGNVQNLLGWIDHGQLRTVMRELAAATDGTGDDVDRLLTSTDQLTVALDQNWPRARSLLRNGETVGTLIAGQNDRLRGLSRDALVLSRWLRTFDPEFRRILARSPRNFDRLYAFTEQMRRVLPPTLSALVRLSDLLWRREPHLRALAPSLEYGASRFASAFSGGWLNIDINLEGQEHCEYGTPRRSPTSTDRRPMYRDGRCSMTDQVWRGGEHAPPPLNR